jgi:hypothetical protein
MHDFAAILAAATGLCCLAVAANNCSPWFRVERGAPALAAVMWPKAWAAPPGRFAPDWWP